MLSLQNEIGSTAGFEMFSAHGQKTKQIKTMTPLDTAGLLCTFCDLSGKTYWGLISGDYRTAAYVIKSSPVKSRFTAK